MSKSKNRPGVDMDIIGDRNATAAAVTVRMPWPGARLLEVKAAGTAKREPGDRCENETGAALALARAMRNAADSLERLARQRVTDVEREAAQGQIERLRRKGWGVPRPQLKTAEIREKWGDEAAELHKARKRARRAREVYDGA